MKNNQRSISDTQKSCRLLRLPEVKHQTGLGRSSIYAKIKAHTFPPPIKLGERCVAWLSNDISAWVNKQIASSRCKG